MIRCAIRAIEPNTVFADFTSFDLVYSSLRTGNLLTNAKYDHVLIKNNKLVRSTRILQVGRNRPA